MKHMGTAFLLLFLAGAILFAGCAQSQVPPATPTPTPATPTPTPVPDTIKATTNPQYGMILTDAAGKTLYYFARDTPGAGTSACTGTCLTNWPAFTAGTVQVSAPLQAADFGTITRADNGQKQTAYRGWPLYYYAADTAPGDTKGYGILSVWYVMSPTGVVTLAPTTTVPTTIPTTVKTTAPPSYGGGGGGY